MLINGLPGVYIKVDSDAGQKISQKRGVGLTLSAFFVSLLTIVNLMAKSKGVDAALLIGLIAKLVIGLCSLTIAVIMTFVIFMLHALAALFHMIDHLMVKLVPEAKVDSTLEYPFISVEFEPRGTK